MKTYAAPWSLSLKVMTSLATVVCLGATILLVIKADERVAMIVPLILAGAGALSFIRGYAISSGAVEVQRLFWTTHLSLAGLRSATFEPNVMRGSIRTFGNGGFCAFTGYYYKKSLGTYRAFVTDPRQTVVLRFTARRPIVLSPAQPEEFVQEIGLRNANGSA